MDFNIAKKAIDYYIPRVKFNGLATISFFGGEPLLNYELIKKLVDYINRNFKNIKKIFHVTTNGTLINKDISKFFIENEFLLNISLDGPKNIHDRYRLFPNGAGSFDKIRRNLLSIKNMNEKYFRSKVYLQPVLVPPFCYKEVFDFFYKDELFSLVSYVGLGYVTLRGSKIKLNIYNKRNMLNDNNYLKQQKYNYLISKQKREKNKMFFNFFMKDLLRIYNRPQGLEKHLKDFIHVPGICLPGNRKLFVDCDGKYHMCEKVERSIPIGNVEDGLNIKKLINQ